MCPPEKEYKVVRDYQHKTISRNKNVYWNNNPKTYIAPYIVDFLLENAV